MVDIDAGMAEALRRDDPADAKQLIERHADRLYRLALCIAGFEEDAEEAVAEALVTGAKMIATLTDESAFRSWIDRAAATAAYHKLRRRRRPTEEIALVDIVPALDGNGRHFEPMEDWSSRIDDQVLKGGLRDILIAAIDALPADYRTALVLHDVEGVSASDIAQVLALDIPAVKSRVHHARLFVRKRLSNYFESAAVA